jgi:hypothetical protein
MLLILAEAYETVEDPSNALLISTRMKALTSTRQINFDYLQRVEEQLQRLRQAKLSVR